MTRTDDLRPCGPGRCRRSGLALAHSLGRLAEAGFVNDFQGGCPGRFDPLYGASRLGKRVAVMPDRRRSRSTLRMEESRP